MKHSLELLRYIGKQVTASGKKRIIYSIVNILLMAAVVGSAIGIRTLYLGMGEINVFAAIIGIILLAALCIIFALDGVIAQLVLLVASGIGMFNKAEPDNRAANVIAFIIALLSTVGVAAALAIYLSAT